MNSPTHTFHASLHIAARHPRQSQGEGGFVHIEEQFRAVSHADGVELLGTTREHER